MKDGARHVSRVRTQITPTAIIMDVTHWGPLPTCRVMHDAGDAFMLSTWHSVIYVLQPAQGRQDVDALSRRLIFEDDAGQFMIAGDEAMVNGMDDDVIEALQDNLRTWHAQPSRCEPSFARMFADVFREVLNDYERGLRLTHPTRGGAPNDGQRKRPKRH
jgi:hypothetical protein